MRSIIRARRSDVHSEKPIEVVQLLERWYPGLPKLEMFCRVPRDGWSVWGNQVGAAPGEHDWQPAGSTAAGEKFSCDVCGCTGVRVRGEIKRTAKYKAKRWAICSGEPLVAADE